MEGVRVSRRSLNSVSQDLAPLMTIEDDDVDEGVILIHPSNSPTSSPPELNESSVVLSKSSSVKKAVSRGSTCLRWTLGALLILSGVALNVSIPIYTVIMSEKSDIFIMNLYMCFWAGVVFLAIWVVQCLFFSEHNQESSENRRRFYFFPKFASFKSLLLLAFSNDVTMILISFAMLPSRTPKPLQAILVSGAVISATIFRKLLLNRGVSVRRIICLGAVMLGLFVAAEPEIFHLPMTKILHKGGVGSEDMILMHASASNHSSAHSSLMLGAIEDEDAPSPYSSGSIFWAVILILSNVPAGLAWVLFERESTRRPREVFLLNLHVQIYSFFVYAVFFAVDLAPGFGQADSVGDFWRRLVNGFYCHYQPSSLPDSHCGEALVVSFVAVAASVGFLGFQTLLMAFDEGGATFSIIVSYLSVPLSSIFWLLFDFKVDGGFVWAPLISFTALFPVLGFTIMCPAIILFNLFGTWEAQVTYDY